ncbi:MAG TPA: substrate-binding domain-containing protein [Sphingobacteriaceae bacterium]
MVWPALTTIMQPSHEVGKLATQLLIDEIENGATTVQEKVLHTELLVRASS